MSSATEAELAGLYIFYIRIILEELRHAQPPTQLQTIMQWQTASSMVKYNPNKPKPWT
jgi:hypothetical protein